MTGGRAATFDAIYEEHGAGLYRYLLGRVRRVDVAEDLLQSVMLRVVRNRRKLRTIENSRAWLFTIARNELSRHFSKAARRGNDTDDGPIPLVAAPDERENGDLGALRAALSCLAPKRWEVVSLKVYQMVLWEICGRAIRSRARFL